MYVKMYNSLICFVTYNLSTFCMFHRYVCEYPCRSLSINVTNVHTALVNSIYNVHIIICYNRPVLCDVIFI